MIPEVQLVSLKRASGNVAIMSFVTRGRFAPDTALEILQREQLPITNLGVNGRFFVVTREPTPTAVQAEIERSTVKDVVSWRLITIDDIPSSRRYRRSWSEDGSAVVLDLQLARSERLAQLREARNKRLDELDKDWMRAFGQGDATLAATIETERQTLRDMPTRVTPLLDAAQTEAELDAVTL